MASSDRFRPVIGSLIFFFVAPGTVAGLVPWSISGYAILPPFLGFEPFRWLGAALLALGAVLIIEGFGRFALEGRGTPAPIYPTETLVVTGSYRFVRNPIYVALVSLIFGQALLFGSVAVLVYGLVVWGLVHLFVLVYEEPALQQTFGTHYEAYRAGVRRWIPRLTPWRG
jgi:protein-S-isoprenylcysteine O-methyltransferase Ste14